MAWYFGGDDAPVPAVEPELNEGVFRLEREPPRPVSPLPGTTAPRELFKKDLELIRSLLAARTCFEVIPESGKIVVIDSGISIKNAFFALMENEIRCAPLWDSSKKTFVGMITMTHFITMLCHFYERNDKAPILKEIEDKRVSVFSEIAEQKADATRPVAARGFQLITTVPDDSLLNISKLFVQHNIHRIPIVEPSDRSIIHIVTHVKVIRHLLAVLPEQRPPIFSRTIREVRLGSWEKLVTRPLGTRLIDIFHLMVQTGYSAIPIVDANSRLFDVYSKGDVPSLAIHRTYNQLLRPVEEVIAESRSKKNLNTCTTSNTLHEVLERLLSMKTHRLFCVDDQFRIKGIISMIDVLKFFLAE